LVQQRNILILVLGAVLYHGTVLAVLSLKCVLIMLEFIAWFGSPWATYLAAKFVIIQYVELFATSMAFLACATLDERGTPFFIVLSAGIAFITGYLLMLIPCRGEGLLCFIAVPVDTALAVKAYLLKRRARAVSQLYRDSAEADMIPPWRFIENVGERRPSHEIRTGIS